MEVVGHTTQSSGISKQLGAKNDQSTIMTPKEKTEKESPVIHVIKKQTGPLAGSREGKSPTNTVPASKASRKRTCPRTLMGPELKELKRRGPRAGPGPGECLLVCCARSQGSVGWAAYFGVYNKNTHVGGQLIAAPLRPTVLALRGTQS